MQATPPSPPGPAVAVVTASMRELLAWVARGPRTYADAMKAWRSSCPRYTIWEDVLEAGLVRTERNGEHGDLLVSLTPRGQAALGGS